MSYSYTGRPEGSCTPDLLLSLTIYRHLSPLLEFEFTLKAHSRGFRAHTEYTPVYLRYEAAVTDFQKRANSLEWAEEVRQGLGRSTDSHTTIELRAV